MNIFFFEFAWEFCIEKWRGFLVNFFWSLTLCFPRNEARKILEKFGENSEQNSGQNSGQKFEKFGRLSFCDFSDLRNCAEKPMSWVPIGRGGSEDFHRKRGKIAENRTLTDLPLTRKLK